MYKVKQNLPRKISKNQRLSKVMIKSYDKKNELSPRSIEALQKHSVNHSAKHIKEMVRKMTKFGYSFRKAHTTTMIKVGK